jgi:hypothetical protein
MASNRTELNALKNLISEADLILETNPPLPENRTAAAREALRAALALTDEGACGVARVSVDLDG